MSYDNYGQKYAPSQPHGGPTDDQSHSPHAQGNVPPNYGYPPPNQGPAIVSQPIASQSTTVVVNMPGGGNMGTREWSTGLCGCCEDVGGCMCVWCCYTCQVTELAVRLGESSCMPCCVPNALMALRVKLRTANRIQGSIFKDCCVTAYCPCLALCQMKRELDNIEAGKL